MVFHRVYYNQMFSVVHVDASAAAAAFETILAKGEIAHIEQFLFLPHCFQLY